MFSAEERGKTESVVILARPGGRLQLSWHPCQMRSSVSLHYLRSAPSRRFAAASTAFLPGYRSALAQTWVAPGASATVAAKWTTDQATNRAAEQEHSPTPRRCSSPRQSNASPRRLRQLRASCSASNCGPFKKQNLNCLSGASTRPRRCVGLMRFH